MPERMPFLPETWKAKVTECLWEWWLRVEQARPAAFYSTLSAAALWPLVQASQSTGMLPVALALGNVVAGVGGNLIAEQIQRWHDQASPTSEADIAIWITTHITTNADLRQPQRQDQAGRAGADNQNLFFHCAPSVMHAYHGGAADASHELGQ